MKRRAFLRNSLAVGVGSVIGGGLTGCGQQAAEPQTPMPFVPGQPVPWVNWAGNQSCMPESRFSPASEDELVNVLKSAKGVIVLSTRV